MSSSGSSSWHAHGPPGTEQVPVGAPAMARSECESTLHAHFPNKTCGQKLNRQSRSLHEAHRSVEGPFSQMWVQQPASFTATLTSDQIKCHGFSYVLLLLFCKR